MNPFVNPRKRGVTLPSGCKDLIDVFALPKPERNQVIRRFIHLVLLQAQQDRATEVVICTALPKGGTPIRYKVEGTWFDIAPFPSHLRAGVISELSRMAKLPAGLKSGQGVLDVSFGGVRLKWLVAITSAKGDCWLRPIED